MKITLNGQEKEYNIDLTLEALLNDLGYVDKKIAVEVNEEIIPRSQIGNTLVVDGDRIELIIAVGGG